MNERSILIDIIKGYAIILVVIGHSIQFNLKDFDQNYIFKLIYSFHMPLFIFISGFVSFRTFDGSSQKLYKRFKSLIIPFWSWFLISFIISFFIFLLNGGIKPVFLDSVIKILKYPDNGLWFLWVLFLNHFILFLSIKIYKGKEDLVMFFFFLILNFLLLVFKFEYLGIKQLCWFMPFYLFGYITNKYMLLIKKTFRLFCIFSIIIFPILAFFWSRTGEVTSLHLSIISFYEKLLVFTLFKYVVAISGICTTLIVFEYIKNFASPIEKIFIPFGRVSLEIYSTHFYFFYLIVLFSSFTPFWRIIITFIAALLGSVLVQYLLKKNRYLSMILYGK